MSVDNTDLQIIYELRWKSDIGNGYNTDKVNIMGIYDTPDTCADWTTFKSYLMLNSGANEDISVAYIDTDGEEIMLNSANYKSTLEYYREKARKKEKVILILKKPKSKDHHKMTQHRMKHHDKNGGSRHHEFCTRRHFPNPFSFVADITDSEDDDEQPPLWFLKYMKKFKQEIGDLIADSLYCMMVNGENVHPPEQVQLVNEKKKNKKKFCDEDSSDCVDEFSLGDRLYKVVHKLQAREKKIQRKYETKIGKLEHKVKRIIDKKTGLRSEKPHTSLGSASVSKPKKHCSSVQNSTAPATQTPSAPTLPAEIKIEKPKRCYSNRLPNYDNVTKNASLHKNVSFKAEKAAACCENYTIPDEVIAMNAIPLNRQMVTEFAGRGEIITKRWEVMNNGLSPWTDETELRFTWGSSTLVPTTTVVKVPHLKPGETDVVEVTMQAPDALGRFESYWYFFHSGVRFGHWLGCAYAIGLQKYDRCQPMYYVNSCPVNNASVTAVDLTTTKCPRYYMENNISTCSSTSSKCRRYHHHITNNNTNNNNISACATTDDMKMSKSNSDKTIQSEIEKVDTSKTNQTEIINPVDYVISKPEKFESETTEVNDVVNKPSTSAVTLTTLLMENNESNVECLKPNMYESKSSPLSNDELLNFDSVDKINNKSLSETHDEENEETNDDGYLLNGDSDSDNISVISGTISVGSTDHGDDFVMIPTMSELKKPESLNITSIIELASENPIESVDNLDTNENTLENLRTTETVSPVSSPTNIEEVSSTVVEKPLCYTSENNTTKIEKPISYSGIMTSQQCAMNDTKNEKPVCYSSATITNDPIIELVQKIQSQTIESDKLESTTNTPECSHHSDCKKPSQFDSNTYPPPFLHSGFAHCNFGDPNCGSGPNGPRFPPSCYAHSSQNSHPTWRNGCSVFGNDFATCDQTKKPETADGSSHFDVPYPGALRASNYTNPEGYFFPYPGYMPHTNDCEYLNYPQQLNDSNTRRFVFNNSGTGFETYPQQQQSSANETTERTAVPNAEARKSALYSYVYGEGKPISTQIPKPDAPLRSTVNSATQSPPNGVHILPETIVNGAIQVASNAFNKACNVYDMIRGEGEHNNGQQVSRGTSVDLSTNGGTSPSTEQQRRMSLSSNGTSRSEQMNSKSLDNGLHILYEMGFYNRELNMKLLKRYDNDLPTVISKLV